METAVERRHFVALTPRELPAAQQGIAEWCRATIVALGQELREQRQNLAQAKAAKWKHSNWAAMINRTKARMIYYTKIQAAVRAGYLIVPNFDVEVMAVRVDRARPPQTTATYRSDSSIASAKPGLLPPGVGRYVDGTQLTVDESFTEPVPNKPNEQRTVRRYRADSYDTPDFPVLAVKPSILEATSRAMALKLFDRIGVVTGQKKDPVVIGELFNPIDKYRQKRVSFFIAWWLDTNSL